MKIHVIIGSTRQKRFSEKPARRIYEVAKKRKELDVELVDKDRISTSSPITKQAAGRREE